jgi:hypothetical protein
MYFEKYLKDKKAVVINLDDALYPQKDYLLQVYYLFSEFIEYSEQRDAKEILKFMSEHYAAHGPNQVFESAVKALDIPNKYETNFSLLHENARLPLKLLMYKNVLELLQEVVINRLELFVIAEGSSAVAINKIKQLEWNGLEKNLKVYFAAEYDNSYNSTISALQNDCNFADTELFLIVDDRSRVGDLNKKLTVFQVDEIL